MSIVGTTIQQPVERFDYDFVFETWLAPNADSIDAVATSIVADPKNQGDPSLVLEYFIVNAYTVKLWVSGGVNGEQYTAEVKVTTASGRIRQEELIVIIKEF